MPDVSPEEVQQFRERLNAALNDPPADKQPIYDVLRLCDTVEHLRAEVDGKVLWRGKTGPLPGVANGRLSLITAEIAPGTEVAVVLTEHESATRGTGICPTCERPIGDHDDSERKACHDAVSGYRRAVVLTGEDGDA